MNHGAPTAELTRGAGPREWQAYRAAGHAPIVVFYGCPFCNQLNSLGTTRISAPGLVAELVTCPQPTCQLTYQLFLEGWRFGQVEHRGAVGAHCQADGCACC